MIELAALRHGAGSRDIALEFTATLWLHAAAEGEASELLSAAAKSKVARLKARALAWDIFCAERGVDPTAYGESAYHMQASTIARPFGDVPNDTTECISSLELLRAIWRDGMGSGTNG